MEDFEIIENALIKNIDIFFPQSNKKEEEDYLISVFYDKECVNFYLYNEKYIYIKIEQINKCNYSGTQILENIEFLAKGTSSSIKSIKLDDASNVMINKKLKISLKYLYILSKGESWYNSLGYYSIDHKKNKEEWNILRNKNMSHIFSEILGFNNNILNINYYFKLGVKHMSEIFNLKEIIIESLKYVEKNWKLMYNNNIKELEVNVVYSMIHVIIKHDNDIFDDFANMFYILLSFITPLIKYNPKLEKKLF